MSTHFSWNHGFLRRPSKNLIKDLVYPTGCKGEKLLLVGAAAAWARGSAGTAPKGSTGTGAPWLCEASEHTPEVLLHPPVSHCSSFHGNQELHRQKLQTEPVFSH